MISALTTTYVVQNQLFETKADDKKQAVDGNGSSRLCACAKKKKKNVKIAMIVTKI